MRAGSLDAIGTGREHTAQEAAPPALALVNDLHLHRLAWNRIGDEDQVAFFVATNRLSGGSHARQFYGNGRVHRCIVPREQGAANRTKQTLGALLVHRIDS